MLNTAITIINPITKMYSSLHEYRQVHLREDFEPWIPIDIGMDREERNRIFEKAGVRMTPMLFIDDQYVGNFDDVSILVSSFFALL